MDTMERLARERRGRLAAERLLELRTRELFAANEKLALHARALSEQIVEQREVVQSARDEAAELKGLNSRFVGELERAHTSAIMAERRLRDSIDTIRDGFAVFDASLRLITANRSWTRAFHGFDMRQGVTYGDLLVAMMSQGLANPGDESPQAWIARMAARLDLDPIPPETVRLATGAWVRLHERRARDGGLVCLAVDTTEQMRIWAAIEALPDGFVLFDREERLLACNQHYRDMFPDSAAAAVPGAKFEDLLRFGLQNGHVPEAKGREEAWLEARLAQLREARTASECRLADGRWIREMDHPTPDGGRVGLRSDITHLREQQAALEEARRAAEAATRAKSAFLANMSHEIRTPMNGVVGMAELLCDTRLTEEQRLFAETIRSSGEALLAIINDILDYSRIEADRLTLHPEPFDLERTIHEVVMLLQPKARAKGIDMMIDFDVLLPTRYVGDAGRLRQVLTNLVGNAVKFTERGHVLVRVVGMEAGAGAVQLHVAVEDTGIGIPAEHLDHVFGEFNQVEDGRNRKYEGTGLGLAISRRLVECMGGAVWVDSEAGKGSVFGFRFTLPVAEEAAPARPPVDLRHALVVDDRFINRTILERQLAQCGIEVTLCRSGAEALDYFAGGGDCDVVLTDHEMPGMDGVALAAQLRAAGHGMPILLLSSHPAAAREHPQAAALDAILPKPVLRAELYKRLSALAAHTLPAEVHDDAPAPLPPSAPVRRMRILAAEDNRTNQLVFRKMLRDARVDIEIAENGREAVEKWRSFRPDLIFMDISMPEMDGKEAAMAIRAAEGAESHIPIVALTAHVMEGDAEAILAAGIDGYLAKPLRRSAIVEALTRHCPADVQPPMPAPHDGA